LIVAEEELPGEVTWEVYRKFLNYSYGNWGIFGYLLISSVCGFTQLFTSYYLSKWTGLKFEEQQKEIHPAIFGGSIIIYIGLTFIRALVIFKIILTSSKNLHDTILTKVARSKILFFDSNPVGRILARFSKDITVLDMLLPFITVFATFGIFRTITVTITLVLIHPILLIFVFIAGFLLYQVHKYQIGVINEAQKKDGVYRGPLSTSFTNVVSGLVTIRTFERLPHYRRIFIDDLEKSCNATFSFSATQ